jgi:hypothetical protein
VDRHLRSGRPGSGALRAAACLAAVAYAWWAVGLAPFSAAATVAVVGAGVVAAAAGSRARRPAGRTVAVRHAAPWIAVAVAATTLQLASYLQQPRRDHPTLSSLTNALLDSQPARAAAFACWLALAAVLARR